MYYPSPAPLSIEHRLIGDSQPLFIIAEIGVTCNYDLQISKELIDVAQDSGADAVKFIFWFPEEILSDHSVTFTYEVSSGEQRTENMLEMLSKLRFSLEQWRELKAYADARRVILFSTVNSPGGAVLARELGLAAYKLSSWDYNYLPLWEELAGCGKPLLIDTGPVTSLDVAKVIDIVRRRGNDQIALLHCFKTSQYAEVNMLAIPYMRAAFGVHVGFSATGRDSTLDTVAVSLGASILEKRLTLSRALPGHHHVLAKEPKEFAEYVKQMQDVHSSLGVFGLKPSPKDLAERKKAFRRLVAERDIESGEVLERSMIGCKRPEEGGVSPEFLPYFIGRRMKRRLKLNEPIQWEDLA